MSALEAMSTNRLYQKKRFSTIALNTVWIGAAVAICASVYRLFLDGAIPGDTFLMAMLALLASIPVYLERKQIFAILEERGKQVR